VVFTRTKHGADKVGKKLWQIGIQAETIHGNKSQGQRKRALDRFSSGAARILVATDVAARGLDVENISHVVNFDMPVEPEAYIHRIGRTGRAGASGTALSFCDVEERGTLRDIERLTGTKIPVRETPAVPARPAWRAHVAGNQPAKHAVVDRLSGDRPARHPKFVPQHNGHQDRSATQSANRPPKPGARPGKRRAWNGRKAKPHSGVR
jgi:ATP-dependent RNA helicase RhlE